MEKHTSIYGASLCFSDNKKKWIDPKVIELNDNSEDEPEDDFDYIPPSPVPDEISFKTSTVERRLVFSLHCILYL